MTDKEAATFCLPAPRQGRREFVEDSSARLGTHIKLAEQVMLAAKTDALNPFELTVAQYAVLMSLYYVPEQSAAELARGLGVKPQTMGQTLDRLEAKALVLRTASTLHRRVQVITLTPKGKELVLRADEATRAVEQRLGEAFSPEERAQLRELLQRAAAALRGDGDLG